MSSTIGVFWVLLIGVAVIGVSALSHYGLQTGLSTICLSIANQLRLIMAKIDDLKAAQEANAAETAKLTGKVEALTTAVGNVVTALQDLRNSGGATAAELDALITQVNADTAATQQAEAGVDAATAAATGATTAEPGAPV